jgi:sarcosine oxidase delta subunit
MDYFRKYFIDIDGAYYTMMQAFRAASIFNSMKARGGLTIQQIETLIDDLTFFGFQEFTNDGLAKMKQKVDTLPPGAKEYNDHVLHRRNHRGDDNQSWKDDEAEVARRIWEWWALHNDRFVHFKLVVRLVVLVQTSSASVERIFSELKRILEVT